MTFADNHRLPDNAIYHFCEQAKKLGVDIFRVFDALNDVDQLEVGMKAVHKVGGVVEAAVCYSGDFLVGSSFLLFSFFPWSRALSSIRLYYGFSWTFWTLFLIITLICFISAEQLCSIY